MQRTTCEFCGKELEPVTATINGNTYTLGWQSCDCPENVARIERERQAREAAEMEAAERSRRYRLQAAGIKERYINATHPKAEDYAAEVMDGRNLYIHGGVGTGKTMLAAAVAIKLLDKGEHVCFTSARNILTAVRAAFKWDYDPLTEYVAARVLVLDDLGKESPTDFALEQIFNLVDERSARMVPTIVTTQYKPSELIERLAKNGDYDTAVAIVSRLRENSHAIERFGADRRRP